MTEDFMNTRWLLPEGVEELTPRQAEYLEHLRRRLLDLFHSYGYELVMPPLIEFMDSLSVGTGNDLDLQTFKIIDQLTGRLMGVRADMTPQVARIDAHQLRRETPTRLCYMGTVLHTRAESQGGSRTPLQVGAELYGHAGIESDVEVLDLMLEMMRQLGIRNISVDLGHVGIFRGLSHQAGLSAAQEQALFEALQRKAKPEIVAFLASLNTAGPVSDMLIKLADLNGGPEVLAQARAVLVQADASVHQAIDSLQQIAERARRRNSDVDIHFDLAELRGYHYHTGVVFAAYVPGCSQAVAKGGRYDSIGAAFGRARPATGFSADLRELIKWVDAKPAAVQAIYAPVGEDPALWAKIQKLRASGERVIEALPGQQGSAKEMGCERQLVCQAGQWNVVEIETK
ncbi:MAG: ATP phosphoribosyltransferase regulatory subunit [Pseudomonadota bacterium]